MSGSPTRARAINSPMPPGPLVRVAVTGTPAGTWVVPTLSDGCRIAKGSDALAPPPGGGVLTVIPRLGAVVARSSVETEAVRVFSSTYTVGRG